NPFVDRWALTIPGGRAGWLGITEDGGYLDGSILWGGGSVVPVSSVYMDGDALVVTRVREVERKDAAGEVVRKQQFTDTVTARIDPSDKDAFLLTVEQPNENGQGVARHEFTGKRIPPLPPAPDLSKVKY